MRRTECDGSVSAHVLPDLPKPRQRPRPRAENFSGNHPDHCPDSGDPLSKEVVRGKPLFFFFLAILFDPFFCFHFPACELAPPHLKMSIWSQAVYPGVAV